MSEDALLRQLLTLPTVVHAKLSPDRRWVAFSWYRVHDHVDVFLVPADGSAPPIALTHSPEETVLIGWSADSQAVLVAEDHDGDERISLFRVKIDQPGVCEPLTEAFPPYFLRGGNLNPDGTLLFYGMNYDVEAQRSIEPTWVYRHDLRSGERSVLAKPEKPCWSFPALNADGTWLIYERKDRHPSGMQIHLVDSAGQHDREILNFGDAHKIEARWLNDGRRLAVLSESTDGRPQQHQSLGIYDIRDGSMRWVIDDPQRSIEEIRVTPDGLIVVDEVRSAQHLITVIDPDSGAEVDLPRLAGNMLPIGQAADGTWIAIHYSSTQPSDLVRVLATAHGAESASLTRLSERLHFNLDRLAPAEDFRWTSVDGMEIQGWLYRANPNPQRAIIYVHGGPTAHSEEKLSPQLQYYVARGFNVLDVNYRGSTGFGLAFRESIKADGWGGREQADIASGAEALIAAGLAAPGCVGVTGTSYGGYSSWHQITHTPRQIIAAAAPICGMTDLVIDYETTRPDLRPYSEEMIGGRPDEIPEKYQERSPINYVSNIQGKLLIVQGAQDPNVTPANLHQVVERLAVAGIHFEVLEFADEGHGILKPSNQAILYRRLVDFFGAALEAE